MGPPLVLIHGWPDGPSLWDDLVQRLAPRRCIRVQLPAFPGSEHATGADFPELAEALEQALRETLGDERVVLIGHDWGAVLTYLFVTRHPGRVERVVTLDIGGHLEIQPRFAPFFLGYQAWLIVAETVGGVVPAIGDPMARWMARMVRAPHPERLTAKAGYTYRYAWRSILRSRYKHSMVARFKPRHPHLYLYGTKKPFHFHSPWWVQAVKDHEHGQVVPIAAGHWLMVDRPQEVFEAIDAFLKDPLSDPSRADTHPVAG